METTQKQQTQPPAMKTQLERANDILVAMYQDVTGDDRKKAVTELGYSAVTIGMYLNGNGKNTDTAIKLIEFFKGEIQKREKKIA